MARRPRGILSRNVPDWYCRRLFGAQISVTGVAGQASNCGVFNNSAIGEVYYVYSVAIFVSGNTFVNFKQEKGKNYATFGPEAGFPIDPRTGQGSHITEAGTQVGCLGTHVGGIPMLSTQNQVYAPGWPFLIIPPGYAGVIETANNGLTLQIAMYWLSIKD